MYHTIPSINHDWRQSKNLRSQMSFNPKSQILDPSNNVDLRTNNYIIVSDDLIPVSTDNLGSATLSYSTLKALNSKYRDKKKHRFKNSNNDNAVIKSRVATINLDSVKPERGGCIIYTVVDGITYFGLGLDSKTHDLTDFGGGINYKTDTNVITGALREFQEETLGIFGTITIDDINDCLVIYDNHNLIIFIHVDVNPNELSRIFNHKYRSRMTDIKLLISNRDHDDSQLKDDNSNPTRIWYPEVCGITWSTWEAFQRAIFQKGILYSRVQKFLLRAGNFSTLL